MESAGKIAYSCFCALYPLKGRPFHPNAGFFSRLPLLGQAGLEGLVAGENLAIGLPFLQLVLEGNVPKKPWVYEDTIINSVIRLLTLSLISFLDHW